MDTALDDIIHDKKPRAKPFNRKGRKDTRIGRVNNSYTNNYNTKINTTLRVSNIHPSLNGHDLSTLFSSISPVDYVTFDKNDETTAYIAFIEKSLSICKLAVSKFNNKKAMGLTLSVQINSDLKDRITIRKDTGNPKNITGNTSNLASRVNPKKFQSKRERTPKPKPAPKKNLDTLDEELNAYMNQTSQPADTDSAQDIEID